MDPVFPALRPARLPHTDGCRGSPRPSASSCGCSWEMGRRSREKKPGAGVLLGPRGERSLLSKARRHHCGLSLSAPRPRSGNSIPSCSYQPEAQPSLSTTGVGVSGTPGKPPGPGYRTDTCSPSISVRQISEPASESQTGTVTRDPWHMGPNSPVVRTQGGGRSGLD